MNNNTYVFFLPYLCPQLTLECFLGSGTPRLSYCWRATLQLITLLDWKPAPPVGSIPTLRSSRALVISLILLRTTIETVSQVRLTWFILISEQNALCSLLSEAQNGLKVRKKNWISCIISHSPMTISFPIQMMFQVAIFQVPFPPTHSLNFG